MSVPCKAGSRGQIFHRDLLHYARTVWPRTTKFGRIIHVGKAYFQWVSPPPSVPQFWSSLHLCVHSLTQNDQIWHVGRSIFPVGQPAPTAMGEARAFPILEFPSIYAYTLWHKSTKFDMLGEAYFQWVSPPPLQWANPERSPILEFPSICAYILWHKTTKFDMRGETYFQWVSPPLLQGAKLKPSPISEFPSTYVYILWHRRTKIWRGNTL